MVYEALRALVAGLLAVFYRRIEVVGVERVPRHGPLIVAANHHNALVDPLVVIAALPRALRPVAKAPLFRHPLIAPFLALVGAIPVTLLAIVTELLFAWVERAVTPRGMRESA